MLALPARQDLTQTGTIIVKPIQANLVVDDDLIGQMDPYCKLYIGYHRGKTEVCKDGGKHPYWNRVIGLHKKNETLLEVKLKNFKWAGIRRTTIGGTKIELKDLEPEGKLTKWFEMSHDNKPIGKILLDLQFEPDSIKRTV